MKTVITDKKQLWTTISPKLQDIFGEHAYRGWLRFLVFEEDTGAKIILSVPTAFIRDLIKTKYLDGIKSLLQESSGQMQSIDIIVSGVENNEEKSDLSQPVKNSAKGSLELLPNISALDPRFTFSNFVVGKPNELAYAAALRVAESDKVNFSPLFLYGGVGLGKTHLMHAIAWHLNKLHPKRKVIYLSAEQFMDYYIRSLRHKAMIDFRDMFRNVDVLMVDDIQFMSGKDSTQEEFFHTFNALIDQKKQIILSADKSPSDLTGIEERMRSRFGWGLVVDIHPTTYELRLGILQAKAEKLDVKIPREVLEFLAHKVTSNVRELEGALNKIRARAMLIGGAITLDGTKEALQDLLRANERLLTIDEIQRQVAEHFNIRISDMKSSKRLRNVARPRQVAMYMCKNFTSKSWAAIGEEFGGRDHSTVMHACKKVEELKTSDPDLNEDIHILERILSA
jgi:chromosomal replication initiator protein